MPLVDLDGVVEIIEGKQKELCPLGRYGRNYVYGADREKYDELEELLDKIQSMNVLDTVPQWISVKERLPELPDKQYCSVQVIAAANVNGELKSMCMTFCRTTVRKKVVERFEWHDRICVWEVTHWMPLPEPPKLEDKR